MSDDWCEEDFKNCRFHSLTGQFRPRYPFVQKIHAYDMDKGFLEYTGHYYLLEEDLPERYELRLYKKTYIIEIYRREQLQNLSQYTVEIEDGEEKHMACLTPTHRERIWFHVIPSTETQTTPHPDSASHMPPPASHAT